MSTSAAFGAAGEFAASHHGVISRSQAARLGVDHRRVARLLRLGVVIEPLPGAIVFTASPDTWHRRLAIVLAASGDVAIASHRAAARVQGVDGFADAPLEVVVPNGHRHRLPGAIVHQSRTLCPSDIVEVAGIRCTGLARTLCDLGDVVEIDQVLRALDDVQRRRTSLRWLSETAARLDTPRRAGPRLLAALIAGRVAGYRVPESWFERLLERCLTIPELAGLERQVELTDESGRCVARVDLAVPALRLAFEAHSRRHHFGQVAEGYDEDRDIAAAKIGWEIIYLGFAATRSPLEVGADMAAIARRRATDLGSALPAAVGSGGDR